MMRIDRTQGGRDEREKQLYLCPEDSPDMVEAAGQLSLFGYAPRLLRDTQQLLEAIEKFTPAGVLLEFDTLCHVSDETRLALHIMAKRIPVACLAGDGDIEARLEAARIGCQAYFTRPLDIVSLLDTLDRLTTPPPGRGRQGADHR